MKCLVLHSDITQRGIRRGEMRRGRERWDRQGRKVWITSIGAGLVAFGWWIQSWLLSCGPFCLLQKGDVSHMLVCEMEVSWIPLMHEGGRIDSISPFLQ